MATGCQVDFYVLGSAAQEPGQLACKLALMAWERGHEITVVAASEADAKRLDQLMWEFPEGRFLPHECLSGSERAAAPVRILSTPPPGDCDVVINLTQEALSEPARFGRLLEIVPHREADRRASREKYRSYAAHGLIPSTHEIN